MHKYLVVAPHTAEDCRAAVKHFQDYHAGFLSHFEWGCYDNDHTAYQILDAESHEGALMAVPPLFRPKAKAIQLANFDPKRKQDPLHREKK